MDTKALRKKILDLAIHGKLVPQDPNDEPASVLLERIKAEKEQLILQGKIKKTKKSNTTSDKPHYTSTPFQIPQSWECVPVSQLFILNPKSEISDNLQIGFIPMALVENGFSGSHRYENRLWNEVKSGYCHFQNGDIGIAKISPCFENRKSTIFHNLPNNYGAGTTELVILRPIIIYAKFYLYVFKSDWYLKEGTKYFKGVVGQQRVNKEIFTEQLIPLPPLAEQQRIVSQIEKYFALIDEIEQNKTTLADAISQTKSKILDLAIHGKLVPQDPNDEPAINLLRHINPDFTPCDNEHYTNTPFQIPQSWECVPVSQLFILNPKSEIPDNLQIGFIPMALVENGFSGNHQYEKRLWNEVKSGYCHFQNGDIGIAKISPCFENRKSTVFHNLPNNYGAGTTELVILRPIMIYAKYYLYLFKSDWYLKEGTKYFKGVVGQQRVNKEIFTDLLIPLPPLAEQQRIVEKIEQLFAVLDSMQSSLEA